MNKERLAGYLIAAGVSMAAVGCGANAEESPRQQAIEDEKAHAIAVLSQDLSPDDTFKSAMVYEDYDGDGEPNFGAADVDGDGKEDITAQRIAPTPEEEQILIREYSPEGIVSRETIIFDGRGVIITSDDTDGDGVFERQTDTTVKVSEGQVVVIQGERIDQDGNGEYDMIRRRNVTTGEDIRYMVRSLGTGELESIRNVSPLQRVIEGIRELFAR